MPIAIDPEYRGCTECLTHQYVPLNQASAQQIIAMLDGEMGNHTDYDTKEEILDAGAKYNPREYNEVLEFTLR